MEMSLSLDIAGSFLARLEGLAARLGDLSPAMDKAGSVMVQSVLENFAAQGRPQGWQPLKPGTAARKGHETILIDTGKMMGSVNYSAGRRGAVVSAPVPYAKAMQEGGGHIPPRPFMLFQDADIIAVKGAIEDYLTQGI